MRREVSFLVDGVAAHGDFHLPEGDAPRGAVVLAHGFAGVARPTLTRYAERFAARGLAALTFDYRTFGASEGEPRQLLDIAAQHADWRAAIRWLRARPEVNSARVGLWGTSFSGGHVQHLAAADPEVAAVVAQAPFCDGRADPLPPWQTTRLVAASLRDRLHARLGLGPHYIGAVGHPGDLAVMTSSDALLGLASEPADSLWENRVAARVLLDAANYRPGLRSAQIACPARYDLPTKDTVTPVKPVEEAAERAPKGELVRHEAAHFEIYQEPWFSRVAGGQADFFVKHLAAEPLEEAS